MAHMDALTWLLDSDPAIRWQVMQHLEGSAAEEVAAERRRVATEGWGARLLELQDPDGYWANGAYFPSDTSNLERGPDGRLLGQPWTATTWALSQLRWFGVDPESSDVLQAVALVKDNASWEYAGEPFFEGEVEPCVNGQTVANGSYFGVDVTSIVDRLLGEQMEDGGWNCEQENGSKRGSFDTTIAVIEGLAAFRERSEKASDLDEAIERGEEYLLERQLMLRLSNGELINEAWARFSFPNWWHYDVLRGLDHLRTTRRPDQRVERALDLVENRKGSDGRWKREKVWPGAIHFDVDDPEGQPSRWITLRAMRVLKWGSTS